MKRRIMYVSWREDENASLSRGRAASCPGAFEVHATELRTRVTGLRRQIAAGGIATSLLDEGSPLVAAPETGSLGRLGVIAGSRAARRDFVRLKAEVRSHPHLAAQARRLLPAARSFYEDRQRLSRLHELRALLGSWRFLHRWLAIVMIVLAVFHIAIAVEYGELWILGGRP